MDIGPYLARLALVLPALCLLIAALLWLARQRLGLPLAAPGIAPDGGVRVAAWASLGAGHRLAIVDFAGRRLLLGVGRGELVLLADSVHAAQDAPASLPSRPSASASGQPGLSGQSGFAATLARRLAGHDA